MRPLTFEKIMSEQYQFDFKDWRDAFEMFYRKHCGEELRDEAGEYLGFRKGNPKIVLVISTDSYVSGYWIEEGATSDEHTKVYRSVKAVRALESRIIAAQQEAAERIGCEPSEVASLGGVIY